MENKLSEMTLEELWQLFPIILKEYNPQYEKWYIIEQNNLIQQIGEEKIRRISHIGSTAVKGLISKPTVDILMEIDNTCDIVGLKNTLLAMGWILMSSEDAPHMKMVFNKGYTPSGFAEKVYHLHVRTYGDWNELYFRDYLREHSETAAEYGKLKVSLFEKYEHDRDSYTNTKTDFVHKYTDIARNCYQGRYIPK